MSKRDAPRLHARDVIAEEAYFGEYRKVNPNSRPAWA